MARNWALSSYHYPEIGIDDLEKIVQGAVGLTLVWRLQTDSASDVSKEQE